MKKRFLISIVFSALSMTALPLVFSNVKEEVEVTYASSHNQHLDNFSDYTYSGSYYDSITADGEGLNGSLRKQLASLVFPAEWPSYSGSSENSLAVLCQLADEDPENKTNMIYLYSRDSVTKNSASTWNREHVWPKSLSNGNWGTGRAGTDLLHLRPTYNTINSTRSSIPFGEVESGEKLTTKDGMNFGYKGGGYFMPLDATKGDVARIIMYVWSTYVDYYSNLPDITKVFESYDTLLRWHMEDKPDALEGHRNDFCETSIQKNRNPFVDHPEYAWMVFGEKASKSVVDACKDVYPGNNATVTALNIESLPNKTTYYINENLDTTGIKVTATYDNGDVKDVTTKVSYNVYKLETLGTQTIKVSFGGKYTSFNVTVKDYEQVALTSINAYFNTDHFYEGGSYSILKSYLPTDAYPDPTFKYSSSDIEVAYFDVYGTLKAVKPGKTTITAIGRQNDIELTNSFEITIEEKPVPKLSEIYNMKKGDSISCYALYMGAYQTTKNGIFIGDGEYATLIYGYNEAPINQWTPYETYLHVSGTVDIYNGLYEIKESTVKVVSSEVGVKYVSPVVPYVVDGEENEEQDLTICSRPTVITGKVKSLNGEISATTEVTVTMEVGESTIDVFIKKNTGLDYDALKAALVVGETASVRGFMGVYNSKFQIVLPSVLDKVDTVTLSETSVECLVGDVFHLNATASDGGEVMWFVNNDNLSISDGESTNSKYFTANKVGSSIITARRIINDFEYTATCVVTITEAEPVKLDAIEIITLPTKLEYNVGDELDPTGITVIAFYTDEDYNKDVTDEVTYDVTTFDEVGFITVTVSYTDLGSTKTDSFEVTVNFVEKVLQSIKIDSLPDKTEYKVGESLDITGILATANFTDGTSEGIDANDLHVDEYTFTSAGEYEIEVSYTYKSVTKYATFKVTVKKDETPVTPTPVKKGCSGDINSTSIILSVLSGAFLLSLLGVLILRRKKVSK